MYKDTYMRSLAKAVSWRFWATLTTIILVYIFTGQIGTALTVGGLELIFKMMVYFVHERAWEKIRFGRKEVQPAVFWFTGLSGSGKRRLADALYEHMKSKGYKVQRLDGENVRKLFPETGFGRAERLAHIKRIGHLASTLEQNGVFVVASFISPDEEARSFVRSICRNYREIHVATPLEHCQTESAKELYARAKQGQLSQVAGIDYHYEKPSTPELVVDLSAESQESAVAKLLRMSGF